MSRFAVGSHCQRRGWSRWRGFTSVLGLQLLVVHPMSLLRHGSRLLEYDAVLKDAICRGVAGINLRFRHATVTETSSGDTASMLAFMPPVYPTLGLGRSGKIWTL